jgi:hypothetical protein
MKKIEITTQRFLVARPGCDIDATDFDPTLHALLDVGSKLMQVIARGSFATGTTGREYASGWIGFAAQTVPPVTICELIRSGGTVSDRINTPDILQRGHNGLINVSMAIEVNRFSIYYNWPATSFITSGGYGGDPVEVGPFSEIMYTVINRIE